ncbi:hypothetical protein AHIS1_p033 [Acaryochloris phage A-HIS1]|nr:hypothetical protein AHIS1_p033 [Acaryochloris phage A-HIS1]
MKTSDRLAVEAVRKFGFKFPEISINSLVDTFNVSRWLISRYEDVYPCKPFVSRKSRKSLPNFVKTLVSHSEYEYAQECLELTVTTKSKVEKYKRRETKRISKITELAAMLKMPSKRTICGVTVTVDPKNAHILWAYGDFEIIDRYITTFINGERRMLHNLMIPSDMHVFFHKGKPYDYRLVNFELAYNTEVSERNVYFSKNAGKFEACYSIRGTKTHLGYFHDIELAIAARNEAEGYVRPPEVTIADEGILSLRGMPDPRYRR